MTWQNLENDVREQFALLSVPFSESDFGTWVFSSAWGDSDRNSPGEMWLRGDTEQAIREVKIPAFVPVQAAGCSGTRWQELHRKEHQEHCRRWRERNRGYLRAQGKASYQQLKADPIRYAERLKRLADNARRRRAERSAP